MSTYSTKTSLRKIKKIVQYSLDLHIHSNWCIPGLKQVTNAKTQIWIRGLWLLIVLVSFSACLHQIGSRIEYYLRCPVAVDVKLVQNFTFPSVSLCIQDTDALAEFKEKHNLREPTSFECVNQLMYIMEAVENVSVKDIWKLTDITPMLSQLVLKTSEGKKPLENPTDVFSPMGLCKTLSSFPIKNPSTDQIKVQFKKPTKLCEYSSVTGSLHDPNSNGISDLHYVFTFATLQTIFLFMTYTQYEFLNRKQSPCVDHEIYDKCTLQCHLNMYKTKNISCKFPFLPTELNLPYCLTNPNSSIRQFYMESMEFYLRADLSTHCNCPRRCTKINYEIGFLNTAINQNESTFYVTFRDDFILVVTEQRSFTIDSLITDLGGSFGLFFGLSCLSILQFIQSVACYAFTKYQLQQCDSQLVKRIDSKINFQLNQRKKSRSKLYYTAIVLCFFICFYLFMKRLLYFWSEPTRIIAVVQNQSNMTFPKLTLCTYPQQYFQAVRKSLKKFNNFNMSLCDATLLNLLSFNYTAESIWSLTNPKSTLMPSEYTHRFLKDSLGVATLHEKSSFYINTTNGECLLYDIGSHEFTGTSTVYLITKLKNSNNCDNLYTIAFISHGNQTTDLKFYLKLYEGTAAIMMALKQIKRYNTKRNPCTKNRIKNQQCRVNCLEKKLTNLTCRLPYMPIDVPMCDSTNSAIIAEKKYYESLFDETTCNCVKPCTEIALTVNVYSEPSQFFSDVGNIMGLMLGYCGPAIFEAAIEFLNYHIFN